MHHKLTKESQNVAACEGPEAYEDLIVAAFGPNYDAL